MTIEASGLTSRQRLVSAATELFVRDGYRGTSMKAIAEHVGLSAPAVYWHFSSKEELYLASMEDLLDHFLEFVRSRVAAAETPVEQLRQFVIAHVTWRLQEREAAGAFTAAVGSRDLVHSLPLGHRASLTAKQRQHLDRLGSILTRGRNAGEFRDDSRVTVLAIVTVCDYVSSWYDPGGSMPPHQIAALYANCIAQMISAAQFDPGSAVNAPVEGSLSAAAANSTAPRGNAT